MKNPKTKSTTLAVRAALLVGCVFAMPTFAAEEATVEAEPKTAEELQEDFEKNNKNVLVITGIRGSLKDNLNQKRSANAIMDSLNTEDIEKNPDKNMAEALQRISGVQITRDFGEGAKVSIRGTSPEFTKTLVNGQEALSAEWLPSATAIKNGAFDFSSMPAEQISRIEVYKSSQADIESGGIGGTVILRTKTPLEMKNGYGRIAFDNEYNDGSGKNSPQLNGAYNWVNEDKTMGAIINISYQERNLLRNSNEVAQGWFDYYRTAREVFLWENFRASWIREGNIPGYPMAGQFEQQRERASIDTTFEFAPSNEWDMTLNHRRNESQMGNQSHALLARTFQMSRQLYRAGAVGDQNPPGYTSGGFGDYVAALDINLLDARNGFAGDRAVYFEFQDRDGTETSTNATTFKSEYQTDTITWETWLGQTSADSIIKDRSTQFRLNRDAAADSILAGIDFHYDYDPENQIISWNLSDDSILTNPGAAYVVSNLSDNNYDIENKSQFFQTDLEWHLDNDFYITSVKFGTKLRTKERDSYRDFSYVDFADGSHPLAGDWASGTVSGIFDSRNAMPSEYSDYSHQARQDYLNSLSVVASGDCTTTCIINNGPVASNLYNQKEEYRAIYALANFSGEIGEIGFRGNVGVRSLNVETTTKAYKEVDGEIVADINSGETTDYLPSFNIAIEVSKDIIIRSAAAKTIARPSLGQLTSIITLNSDGDRRSGSTGNPALRPYSSEEFEIGVEWYFDEASLFSITSFQKNLKDYIATVSEPEFVSIDSAGEHFEGNYLISKPRNVTNNTIKGWEVQYQHDFGNNFGILANYTYVDVPDIKYEELHFEAIFDDAGQTIVDWQVELDDDGIPVTTEREIVLPGNSKKTYNLSGYYEDDTWSARLSYNYRGDFFRYADSGGQVVQEARGQLDFKTTYAYTDQLSFAFSILNLTDEQSRTHIIKKQIEADPDFDIDPRYLTDRVTKLQEDFYDSGKRYYVGVNYKF